MTETAKPATKSDTLNAIVPVAGILILIGAIGLLGYLIYKRAGFFTRPESTPEAWRFEKEEVEASPSTTLEDLSASPSAEFSYEELESTTSATIVTDKGEIIFRLFPFLAPKTVANFIGKAEDGFYEGLVFHRVEDWVIQGGDPLGTGSGGGEIPSEFSDAPFKGGSVGVARGPVKEISNDSQFFICIDDCSWLTGDYTLFGEVVEGMEVAKSIGVNEMIMEVEISYE